MILELHVLPAKGRNVLHIGKDTIRKKEAWGARGGNEGRKSAVSERIRSRVS